MKKLTVFSVLFLLSTQVNATIISGWSTYSLSQGGGVTDQTGGLGSTSSSSEVDNSLGNAFATATLTGLNNTPILRSYSEAAESNNSTSGFLSETFGVQGYTYTGGGSTTLTLNLDFTATVTPGANGPDNDTDATARIALIRSSSLDFFPDYATLIFEVAPSGSLVDNADLFILSDGSTLFNKTMVSIDVDPGDDFFVVSYLMTRALRGDIMDASNTFTMNFDDGSNLIAASVSSIPLPAAFWLFGSGLVGLLGLARRHR